MGFEKLQILRITAGRTNDLGNVLYQNGYKQKIYLEGVMSYPEPLREEETEKNAFGVEVVVYSRTSEVVVFEALDVPDSLLFVLQTLKDHDTLKLLLIPDDISSGEDYLYTETDFSVVEITSINQADEVFNRVTLKLEIYAVENVGCDDGNFNLS
jgi:hypothetical protein